MRTDALSRDDWIVGGLALLLAIDLLFLPWFSYLIFSLSATDGPDGWAGILAVLAALAIVGDLLVERLSPQATLPNLGGSRTATRLRLAIAAAVFVALKFIFNIHFSLFGFGFWAGVVLTAALVVATLRVSRDQPVLQRFTTPS
ncbi:hypothetical protein [Acidiphilium sp.]|uniref:hypothetical protein n=1 Tax=Acidiphilium sp. TaxID=527 RepID=UPI0025849FAF|nr:hypothetical protein [Acidiphilium sp.]